MFIHRTYCVESQEFSIDLSRRHVEPELDLDRDYREAVAHGNVMGNLWKTPPASS